MLRLLHISDIHCSEAKLENVLNKEKFDILVLSGDLQCYDLLELLKDVKEKIVAVTGNMDDISLARKLKEWGVLIEGILIKKNGIKIAGVSGLDPITSINELESKYKNELYNLDVLVSHHPPKGVVDKTFLGIRAGLNELREFIEKYDPKLHLCGHIHEARGKELLGKTIVVNPGPLQKGYYAIIEINNEIKVELKKL